MTNQRTMTNWTFEEINYEMLPGETHEARLERIDNELERRRNIVEKLREDFLISLQEFFPMKKRNTPHQKTHWEKDAVEKSS